MLRSLLYVPANSERFIAKAHERGADALILDLEDSVPPEQKALARSGLSVSVSSVGRNGAKVFVRINAERDLILDDAEAALRAGAFGLYLPKARSAADIAHFVGKLEGIEQSLGRPPIRIVALIEDPGAVIDARAIARAPRVWGMALGGEDLALAMDAQPSPEVLHFPKLMVHYAAKAEGLLSFGLLRSTAEYSDSEGLRAAARQARNFGFDGAACVHPAAVPLLNEGFSASAEEIAWAERVVEAAEKALAQGRGSAAVDGKMVDEPVLARARRLLSQCHPSE